MSFFKKIGFFSALILILLLVVGYQLDGWWNFTSLVFIFVIMPLIDHIIGKDPENIPDHKIKIISEEYYYRFIIYIVEI